jgi:hypothetical protein
MGTHIYETGTGGNIPCGAGGHLSGTQSRFTAHESVVERLPTLIQAVQHLQSALSVARDECEFSTTRGYTWKDDTNDVNVEGAKSVADMQSRAEFGYAVDAIVDGLNRYL